MKPEIMKPIISPISPDLIEFELNKAGLLRKTNKGNHEVYCIEGDDSPHVMQEIGRLREVAFRAAGGGTGEPVDIDQHDLGQNAYRQLVVYSPEDRVLIGGYRFKEGSKAILNDGRVNLSTSAYFSFSDNFVQNYLPYSIELGRSWVQPDFQPSQNPRKGIFSLDNLWDGLGTLVIDFPNTKYFIGKVTMYTHFHPKARDLILFFMSKYFPDKDGLLTPIHPLSFHGPTGEFEDWFNGLDFKEAFKILNHHVRQWGENIPPLVNIYMNLSPTMKTFGTANNPHFGDVEETGLMVTIEDIYPDKKERHINNYPGRNRL